MNSEPSLSQLAGILENDGLVAGLEFLNARVDFRFTGLYRLDVDRMRKACLVDKRGGAGLPFLDEVLLEDGLSRYALRDGMFSTGDTMADERLADYRFAGMVGSCFIVRLVDAAGKLWGTFLHFDMINRDIDADEAAFLLQLPPLLSRFVDDNCERDTAPAGLPGTRQVKK